MNSKAFFFAISDNYSFALANVLMSLNRHNPELMRQVDIIVCSDGVSQENRDRLCRLHPGIIFEEMEFPESWSEILEDRRTKLWSPHVLTKLFGFRFVRQYEKVLMLDVDILIQGDISELFDIEEDLAWRDVMIWSMPIDGRRCLGGNGGVILVSNSVNQYAIGDTDIVNAFHKTKHFNFGGNDEKVLLWLAVERGMSVKSLEMPVYNTPTYYSTANTKLIHFLEHKGVPTKPWKSLPAYLYYTEWADNYERWIAMGGTGPVNYGKEDYWSLFSFDKAIKIADLNKELGLKTKELTQKSDELMKKRKELDRKQAELKKMTAAYRAIEDAKFWKMTYPLRWLVDKVRKLVRKMR